MLYRLDVFAEACAPTALAIRKDADLSKVAGDLAVDLAAGGRLLELGKEFFINPSGESVEWLIAKTCVEIAEKAASEGFSLPIVSLNTWLKSAGEGGIDPGWTEGATHDYLTDFLKTVFHLRRRR